MGLDVLQQVFWMLCHFFEFDLCICEVKFNLGTYLFIENQVTKNKKPVVMSNGYATGNSIQGQLGYLSVRKKGFKENLYNHAFSYLVVVSS